MAAKDLRMKATLALVAIFFLVMASLSIPISVVYGVYAWAVIGVAFKLALWAAVKLWLVLFGLGIIVGMPCHFKAHS